MIEIKFRAWHKTRKKWFRFDKFYYCDEYNLLAWELNPEDEDPDGGAYMNLESSSSDWEKIEMIS